MKRTRFDPEKIRRIYDKYGSIEKAAFAKKKELDTAKKELTKIQPRLKAEKREVAEKEKGKNVLVVWHGTIMRAVLSQIMGVGIRDERIIVRNCSVTVLEWDGRDFSVKSVGDKNHEEVA